MVVPVFPAAGLSTGWLEVCCLPRADFPTLLQLAPGILFRRLLPERMVRRMRVKEFQLTSESTAAFELDGEWVGHLPATFRIGPQQLRVVVP